MRIDTFNKVSQVYQANSTKKLAKTNNTGKTSDSFEISQAGKDFQIAKQSVASVPDVRTDLVNSIKQRMNEGTYNVSDEDLANKLLNDYFG